VLTNEAVGVAATDGVEGGNGLNPMLHGHLMLFWGCTLNELVSARIEQEDACCARMEERKRRPLSGLGALHLSTTWSTPLL
jgi:hypothetical protein